MKRSSGADTSGSGRSSRWDRTGSSSLKKKSSSSLSHYGPAHVEEEYDSEEKRKRPKHSHGERSSGRGDVDRYGPSKTTDNEKGAAKKEEDDEKEPEYKPNFGLSGALAKDMQTGNVYKGVQLKFKEPPEARCPSNTQWRLYVFKKGKEGVLETLHISKQSAYLMGRNADIADIPLLHPSLSGQHAVLQYRAMPITGKGGERVLSCQPYIMDLESTNGTYLNGTQIDPARYYQLKKGDVLTFGASTREYVLMTENTTSTSIA